VAKVNEFQLAVIQALANERYEEAVSATDAKRFLSKLKKDDNTAFAAAVLEQLSVANSVGEAASCLVQMEIELKGAFSAIGALSMKQAAEKASASKELMIETTEAPLQPEFV